MRRLAGWAALALGLAAAAAGCGNRNGSIEGITLEGLGGQGILVVQVDTTRGAPVASALVYLPVPSNRVRLYDNVNNRGYLPFDAIVESERTFSSNWSVFHTTIPQYDPASQHVLLGRGSRDGKENTLSPLTNTAVIPPNDVLLLIAPRDTIPLAPRASVPNPDAAPTAPVDSLFFHVGAVAGAQRIFIEVVKSKVTDYLAMFDRQPDNSFARTFVFENVPPAVGQTYQWHVDEYDAQSRLIAATSVDGSFVIFPPKVNGAPFEWPTASSHFFFPAWTIPGFVAVRPPAR